MSTHAPRNDARVKSFDDIDVLLLEIRMRREAFEKYAHLQVRVERVVRPCAGDCAQCSAWSLASRWHEYYMWLGTRRLKRVTTRSVRTPTLLLSLLFIRLRAVN